MAKTRRAKGTTSSSLKRRLRANTSSQEVIEVTSSRPQRNLSKTKNKNRPNVHIDDAVLVKDNKGSWMPAKIISYMDFDDNDLTHVQIRSMRKPFIGKVKSPSRTRRETSKDLPLGTWVLVHYDGLKHSLDEYIKYDIGGPLCVQTKNCPCANHLANNDDTNTNSTTTRKRKNGTGQKTTPIKKGTPKRTGKRGRPRREKTSPTNSSASASVHSSSENESENDSAFSDSEEGEEEEEEEDDEEDEDDEDDEDDEEESETETSENGSNQEEMTPMATPNKGIRSRRNETRNTPNDDGESMEVEEHIPSGRKKTRSRSRDDNVPQKNGSNKDENGNEVDADNSLEVTPTMILALQNHINVPMSVIFREAKLERGQVNSAYCWMKLENMHRPTIQFAAKKLATWFHSVVDKDPKVKKVVLEAERELRLKAEQEQQLAHARRLSKKEESTASSDVKIDNLIKDIRYDREHKQWTAKFSLDNVPCEIDVGHYASSVDAERAVQAAAIAVNTRIQEFLQVRIPTDGKCALCSSVRVASVGRICSNCSMALQDAAKIAVDNVSHSKRKKRGADEEFVAPFPISECYIKTVVPAPKRKSARRPDGVDCNSNTQWLGSGFVAGHARGHSRTYYTKFRFLDTPDEEYAVLDHVLLFRISPDGAEETEEEETSEEKDGAFSSPSKRNHSHGASAARTDTVLDFYIGQIESMWEEADGSRKARIAWYYWPQEVEGESPDTVQNEVFSSNEVDVMDISSIARKINIVCKSNFDAYCETGRLLTRKLSESSLSNSQQLTKRQLDLHSVAATKETGEHALELGVLLRTKYKTKLENVSTVLLVRRHFHYRAGKVLGDASSANDDGWNQWMHSYVHATYETPQSADYFNPPLDARSICVDVTNELPSDSPLCGKKRSLKEEIEEAPKCAFCFDRLAFVCSLRCASCVDCHICVKCFDLGRQGQVGNGNIKFLHRASHAYTVHEPTMNYEDAAPFAKDVLSYLCKRHGMQEPEYVLIGVARGPLPAKESRGVEVRFLYGVTTDYRQAEWRGSKVSTKLGNQGYIIGTRYCATVEQAQCVAAVDAMYSLFGIANTLSVPVLSSNWTAREAFRLVDSLIANGLAWEPAEEAVDEGRPAVECAEFFYCNLHPFWAARSQWAEQLKYIADHDGRLAQEREIYSRPYPEPGAKTVKEAVDEAMQWSSKVHAMLARRAEVSRRNKRGLAFAVVDGTTVFAKRPSSFGPLVTNNTMKLLAGEPQVNSLLREAEVSDLETPLVADDADVVCLKCHQPNHPETMLLCDGCDSAYHISCLKPPLTRVPDTDWFCSQCMTDREYFYDHASWGQSGGVLCRLVRKHGAWSIDDPNLLDRVREWKDNDEVIAKAAQEAIEDGFGGKRVNRKRGRGEAKVATTPTHDTSEKQQKKAQTTSYALKEQLTPHQQKVEFSWASRHYASATVAALEAANRGLAEALVHVTSQRDALLEYLDKHIGSSK